MRSQPNLIITGTPGVGKTTHCELLAENTGLKHLSINHIAKERECYDGFDEELGSWIVDEDKVSILFFDSEGSREIGEQEIWTAWGGG
jgi:adenylate kinase